MDLSNLDPLITQARAWMPSIPFGPQSVVLLGAIAGQESDDQDERQANSGPAMGYWQFEVEAIREVLTNTQTAASARQAVEASGILADGPVVADGNYSQGEGGYPSTAAPAIATVVWTNFLNFPTLQICFARLMLWANPNPLPALGDCNGAWKYYDSTWRPGAPRPADWPKNYNASLTHFTGASSS